VIDPLEAVFVALKADAGLRALVGDRIAGKHHYATAWSRTQAGLVVAPSGGTPNLYLPLQTLRLRCEAYAPSQPEAMAVWRALIAFSRAKERFSVPLASGQKAFIYAFLQDSGPSFLWDDEVNMDVVAGFFQCTISEQAIT